MEREHHGLSPKFGRFLDRYERLSRAWLMVDAVLEVYSTRDPNKVLRRALEWMRRFDPKGSVWP